MFLLYEIIKNYYPVMAFGASKFNPNGKNELYAPTTFVRHVQDSKN